MSNTNVATLHYLTGTPSAGGRPGDFYFTNGTLRYCSEAGTFVTLGSSSGVYLPLAGGTMTGAAPITFASLDEDLGSIRGANGTGTGNGVSLVFAGGFGGPTSGSGGNTGVFGGDALGGDSNGGRSRLGGGSGFGDGGGGDVDIFGGEAPAAGDGGSISIDGGSSVGGPGGTIALTGGEGATPADRGAVLLTDGSSAILGIRPSAAGDFGIVASATVAGGTGPQTINRPSGRVTIATGNNSLVVTNSLVSANSLVFLQVLSDDDTLTSAVAVPGAGSFTITGIDNATANTNIGFLVINPAS